jgi:hypothetical protein
MVRMASLYKGEGYCYRFARHSRAYNIYAMISIFDEVKSRTGAGGRGESIITAASLSKYRKTPEKIRNTER